MSVDLIRYDLLVQQALRDMVRRVLTDIARDGLPGEHHLYISFATRAPGVRLSSRLLEKYPEEMTIILQHQFWDLIVAETFFEVGLSFNHVPERLHVPFSSLKGFFDPSVKFGLQFEPPETADGEDAAASGPVTAPSGPRAVPDAPAEAPARSMASPARTTSVPATNAGVAPRAVEKRDEPKPQERRRSDPRADAKADEAKPSGLKPVEARPAEPKSGESKAETAKAKRDEPVRPEAGNESSGAQVVRLDSFRKK